MEHTSRDKGKRVTRKRYLGGELPKDIDGIRKSFLSELDEEKWFGDFERIKQGYSAELKSTPRSAREKALREFSVRFTYDTQRIEGSTLTLRETADLIEHRISPNGKPIEDAKEAEAHDKLFREMLEFRGDLSQELVHEWNWRLLRETKPDSAGKIRRHGVRISGSRFVPPAPVELQTMLNDLFDWYRGSKEKAHPVELAGLLHLKFVTFHPFADGNGRISRLMMNFVLHKGDHPMLNIEYNGRIGYYRALERSQVNHDERPFINWFFRRYKRENSHYLNREED